MDKQPVIVHISHTDIRYDSRILKELKALEGIEGVSLKAFGLEDNEGHQYNISPPKYIKVFKLKLRRKKFLPRPIRIILNLIEMIYKLSVPAIKASPTIIHCHDTLVLPVALIVKFFCRCKLVYDAHELESDKAMQSKILSKCTLITEKFAWKYIDMLICVSPSIVDWYNDKLGKKPSLLILNAPVLKNDDNRGKSNYLREKFNIPNNSKIYLYLGIIDRKGRGVEIFVNIFKKLDINSHIVFVGYGNYADEIKKIAEGEAKIHYHPAVPHDQVVKVAKSADVGLCMIETVSLSDYYSLPNKLFEYSFSNIYILASDFPDIKRLVNQYNLGTCCKPNEVDIYNAIKKIESVEIKNNDKDLYPISWQYQAEQLLLGYKNLLN